MINTIFTNGSFLLEEKDYQKLQSKRFGFKDGKVFKLDIYETLLLLEKGKIQILNKKDEVLTFTQISKIKSFDGKIYTVFKDLRSKGYLVKSGLKYGFTFRMYDKGAREKDTHSKWLINVVPDSQKLPLKDFVSKNRVAHTTKKKVITAVVDRENDITYFESSWTKF